MGEKKKKNGRKFNNMIKSVWIKYLEKIKIDYFK